MTAIYIILGLVAGLVIGWLAGSRGKGERDARIELLLEERERQRVEVNNQLARNEELWSARLEKMKEELQKVSEQTLAMKQQSLQENNRHQIGELLEPIHQQFEAFRKSVEDSKTANEASKRELKESFSNTMNLFLQMQNQTIATLKEETERIGNEAYNLTRALKGDTKKQGDWGEMILESLLENSGLEKGKQFVIQENLKDEEGNNLRPDVIVYFPEGRPLVIDSKVSLTAYSEACQTEEETLRTKRLKEHAKSVRKHVDELAGKKYDTLLENSVGFVLMFIPNDQCYRAALEQENDLGNYAYSKGVVIVTPTNLPVALQLAYNLWKQYSRNKNIEEIVKTANGLYEKVAIFSETMGNIEKTIGKLSEEFRKAKNQLYEGNGNVMNRVEKLRELGLTPKKLINRLDVT